MCGIIGYTGEREALPILLDGLKTLEYRGYDSAGVSLCGRDGITTVKSKGRIAELEKKLSGLNGESVTCGIGHTRWATHGIPSDANSHPHSTDRLSLVHNGIIENYSELKRELEKAGYSFSSQTDTEVAAKYIDHIYKKTHDPISAIFDSVCRFRGSFAFGIVFSDTPDTLYAIRRGSPLIAASNENGSFIASDIPAILKYSKQYYRLDEEILAVLGKEEVRFYNKEGAAVTQTCETVTWNAEQAKKGGFPHFMLKEIFDEPEAIRQTLTPHLKDGVPCFGNELLDTDKLLTIGRIHIVACGTAMHAGLFGKSMIEKLARIPVDVEVASEFRYMDPILGKNDLVILLSQSGETADTLAALRHARSQGIYTLAIVNVVDSTVAREADSVIYTWAGPEISVASTKAYTVQCALLYVLALRLACAVGRLTTPEVRAYCSALLSDVPLAVKGVLSMCDTVKETAKHFIRAEHFFFIGRGIDRCLCTEASLKLKEISYIHSEAYAAGELKHGTISLVTDGVPVLALLTVPELAEKMISGIREVKSRGAEVVAVCSSEIASDFDVPCDHMLKLPPISSMLAPFPAATLLQLFAYFIAAEKELDVDKPRNLAKSVTVE